MKLKPLIKVLDMKYKLNIINLDHLFSFELLN